MKNRLFKELVGKMSPEARRRAAGMTLQELRQLCTGLTQAEVADLLQVTQAYVSKVERRTGDMKVSTLRGYVRALGGEIEIWVRLPGKRKLRLGGVR